MTINRSDLSGLELVRKQVSITNPLAAEQLDYLIAQAKAAREAEPVDVVAHMYQHDETGLVGFVDQQQVDWGFQKNNPRLQLCGELMTVAQHNRIMADAPQHDADLAELLRDAMKTIHGLAPGRFAVEELLRAKLATLRHV